MKSVFFAVAFMFAATVFAQDGTKSVLKNGPTVAEEAGTNSTPTQPKVGVVVGEANPSQPTVVATQCCESARLVRLAPWQVRRLNRIAERQEAKKCCCSNKSEKVNCKCDCRKTPAVVVESR